MSTISELQQEIEKLKKEQLQKNASLEEVKPICAGCGKRLDGPHHAQCLDFE